MKLLIWLRSRASVAWVRLLLVHRFAHLVEYHVAFESAVSPYLCSGSYLAEHDPKQMSILSLRLGSGLRVRTLE